MIYFNWLGTWHELQDTDTIEDELPLDFVTEILPNGVPKTHDFVKVCYQNKIYKVHISNIMWKE